MCLLTSLTSTTPLNSGDVVILKGKGHHADCFCHLGEHKLECSVAKPWQKEYAQLCKDFYGGFTPPLTDEERTLFYKDTGYDYDPGTRRVVKRPDNAWDVGNAILRKVGKMIG